MSTYKPSEAAKQTFYNLLENCMMATYHELPAADRPKYALGFAMGYDGLRFPREAIECRAMDKGFMFGAQVEHHGVSQREDDPTEYIEPKES